MRKIIYKISQWRWSKIVAAFQQWRCEHDFAILHTVPVEDWQKPEPHPHPHFSSLLQIQRRRTVGGAVCNKCGKLIIQIGHDQKDLPGAGAEKMETDDKTPHDCIVYPFPR